METGPRNVQENISSSRYPRYRTVCIEGFSSNLPVHVMESGLTQQGLGCIPNKLELHFYTTKLHFYVGCQSSPRIFKKLARKQCFIG